MLINSQARLMWRKLIDGFCTLQRIQFDAPWQPARTPRC